MVNFPTSLKYGGKIMSNVRRILRVLLETEDLERKSLREQMTTDDPNVDYSLWFKESGYMFTFNLDFDRGRELRDTFLSGRDALVLTTPHVSTTSIYVPVSTFKGTNAVKLLFEMLDYLDKKYGHVDELKLDPEYIGLVQRVNRENTVLRSAAVTMEDLRQYQKTGKYGHVKMENWWY